ncbi:MAG: hypothetical protein RJB60_2238 [Pseudomonadota bacterium]|jgi:uncharacterized protein YcfL
MTFTRTAFAAGAMAATLTAALMAATTGTALAQTSPVAPLNPNATNPNQGGGSAASKLMLRGEAYGVSIAEIRAQRRNEMLVVQTELVNGEKSDRQVYWRYRWLDADGMQVGDDDAWKPQRLMGQQSVYLKGVAPKSTVVDFRIEMNVEK